MPVPVKTTVVSLEQMSVGELRALRNDINDEIDKREREEYDKAVEEFRKALYKLYSEFGDECCIINHYQGDSITWEDLYNDYDWNF